MIYLSICIPTKDRSEQVKKTIQSILDDNVNKSFYQIVISDNSDGLETKEYLDTLLPYGINIKYYKNEKRGFYNSIQSLLLGDGELLKLHNDYTSFKKGEFNYLVNQAIKNVDTKPLMFFSNGVLHLRKDEQLCGSFNDFISIASYLITWSSSFSIWRSDLENMKSSQEDVDSMFPHTSLLLNSQCDKYKIIDREMFRNIKVEKKGGYNIFYNFCILFLDMLKNVKKENRISFFTYEKVKFDLYRNFILTWYYRTIIDSKSNYTFDNRDADINIKKAYGLFGLLGVKIIVRIKSLLVLSRKIKYKKWNK
ncbi:glycosyltransferase [Edwardsiella tarda]|uniref:glycosyltransferase n=1 Tax=Edwardsiella tarda TaxID=636 RepID=UPI00098F6EDD|nr:glycosyltransferase [Edwardsiella tarda]